MRACIRSRHHFQPIAGTHPLDIATERGNIELKQIANLARSGNAKLRRHDQDVHLADLYTQRTQRIVINAADRAVERRRRTAMHVLATVSMVADGLSMIVRLRLRCI